MADLALLVLNENIEFRTHIAPICMPYGLQYEDKSLPIGYRGQVAGWGLTTSGGRVSDAVKILENPVVDRSLCKKHSPDSFIPIITADKFCAGFLNANLSVCEGDSGGGLVFPEQERNRTVYYLRGIVSAGPKKENSCDSNQLTTFTNLLYYENLVSKYDVLLAHKLENVNDSSTEVSGLHFIYRIQQILSSYVFCYFASSMPNQ